MYVISTFTCMPALQILLSLKVVFTADSSFDGRAIARLYIEWGYCMRAHHVLLGGLADKSLLCVGAGGDGEGDVHIGAHARFHWASIEAVGALYCVVHQLGLGVVVGLHSREAPRCQQVLEDEAADVDAPAGGSVVHGPLHLLEV